MQQNSTMDMFISGNNSTSEINNVLLEKKNNQSQVYGMKRASERAEGGQDVLKLWQNEPKPNKPRLHNNSVQTNSHCKCCACAIFQ